MMASLRPLLLLLAVAVPALKAAELTTLDGKKLNGDIVAISPMEITFNANGADEKIPITTINAITLGPVPKPVPASTRYIAVELVDGTTFRCSAFSIKGKNVELKLLGDEGKPARTHNIPVTSLFSLMRDAGDLKLEQDFRGLMRDRGKFDVWITRSKVKNDDGTETDRLDSVRGTFGEGDPATDSVKFTLEATGKDVTVKMPRIAGMIFNQIPTGTVAPAICKVVDSDGNVLVAKSVTRADNNYTVTTVSDVKVELAENAISKFDFAAGSVKYLSDLEPVILEESGTDPEHYQKDRNLDRNPIRLRTDPAGMETKADQFAKGLTLHAKTVLTYELKGQYKVFKGQAGTDASVVTESTVKLTIDDGTQVLYKGVIKRGDKPVNLNLNVQNVDRLRIIVESEGAILDLGNQLSIGDAKVLK
ncbi:NPCBM/NEW2 domain-containing protein [Zavarzinella formosa]|uniref:NPCBM/NEW2 domain-containing protein n=1 Tax=Zavarzinella formosa TaxID=360055 RepID=UPI0002F2E716|nr:NPCBM/NEW2 domain-containing protein [Zavarzinella formosa]